MAGRPGLRRRETYQAKRDRLAAVDDPQVVMDAAGRYLEARRRSVSEVRRHLAEAGYRDELVEGVVARLVNLGMLDDVDFARAWVESRDRARPRGERALRQELAAKGIDRETIGEVLLERAAGVDERGEPIDARDGGYEAADRRAAVALLARKSAVLGRVTDPRVRRQRAYALLARNGFDPDVCRAAASEFGAAGDTAGGADSDAVTPDES